MRQQRRFAGFSLYASNTEDMDNSSLCYKDGPQLPPLNFATTCITSGRYVTFYNERLNEVKYPEVYELSTVLTELCEVIVLGRLKRRLYRSITSQRYFWIFDKVSLIWRGTLFWGMSVLPLKNIINLQSIIYSEKLPYHH